MNSRSGISEQADDVQGFDYTDPTTGQFIGTFNMVVPARDQRGWVLISYAEYLKRRAANPNPWYDHHLH